jgi:hypothetical protein
MYKLDDHVACAVAGITGAPYVTNGLLAATAAAMQQSPQQGMSRAAQSLAVIDVTATLLQHVLLVKKAAWRFGTWHTRAVESCKPAVAVTGVRLQLQTD